MFSKINLKGKEFKTKVFQIYLLIYLVGGLIGFVEAGIPGFALGLASSILYSFLAVVLGIVPFFGIFLYFWAVKGVNILLSTLGIKVPVSQTLSFCFFGILAGILWILMTFLAILLLFALIVKKK